MRRGWDAEAATFDDAADHGLRDPTARQAWADLLLPLLPTEPARIVDLGCGTGSLSVLLAQAGHEVHGVDLSPRMIDAARVKATGAGVQIRFDVADAAQPPVAPGSVDVVLARHVLWAFEDPAATLERWISLLAPQGRMVLVEGRWSSGVGIPADECAALVGGQGRQASVRLLPEPTLWGKDIDDERYVLLSLAPDVLGRRDG